MKLPETQVALLEAASATDAKTVAQLAEELGADPAAVTRATFELADRGLLAVDEHVAESYALTQEGDRYLEDGLPERRLYEAACEAGADETPVEIGRVIGATGLDGAAVDIALSNFARRGLGEIDGGEVIADTDAAAETDPEAEALAAVADGSGGDQDPGVLDRLESRGLLERSETTVRSVTLSDEGVTALMEGVETAETVGAVTPDMLSSGEWRDVGFAEYNVEADAETIAGGTEHILRQTANRVKDVLVGMGFREMAGPHADAEFWINDCLFMPQDHPARTHWDQFALDVPPMASVPEDLLERVEEVHRNGVGEDGDGYHSPWSPEVATQVDLRGHTTSLSMRYLSGEAADELEPPQRYFSVEKVYRNDTLDPTHL
ncbi:phenylalanine--tRNA ligase subunit alpha, partial [Halobacteriales archaeon QH_7_69_31]